MESVSIRLQVHFSAVFEIDLVAAKEEGLADIREHVHGATIASKKRERAVRTNNGIRGIS
jgi:hypothetical protein